MAWDGEGVTRNNRHEYLMLRNSRGTGATALQGLSTLESLGALVDGLLRWPNDWHVGFAFSYDVNMIVRDLPRRSLQRLHHNGWVTFANYRLRYRPHKQFTVQRYDRRDGRWRGGTVWDVFGFYQASFVTACMKNGVGDPEVLRAVQAMKRARATFKARDLEAIQQYCEKECELLVYLMRQLKRDMDGAELRVQRWDGAGAVAAALLAREGVKRFKEPAPPAPVLDAVQRAFAGGRIELLRYGHHQGEIHHYDLNSAYPAALRGVPCLAHGAWHHRGAASAAAGLGASVGGPAFALYRVRWAGRAGDRLHPFFWRGRDGRIFYPSSGEGWYWEPEVRAALAVGYTLDLHRLRDRQRRGLANVRALRASDGLGSDRELSALPGNMALQSLRGLGHQHRGPLSQVRQNPNGGAIVPEQRLTILESWTWEPRCDHQPFAFIPPLFEQRRIWKREGKGAEKVLKLGLNSLYGKCAQHVGGAEGQAPAWHQLEWAGWTTSVTRAALYTAAMQAPNDIVFLATDGIYSTAPLQLELGKQLGQWDYQQHEGLTAVQSGVYWVDNADGVDAYHRGFDPESISRARVLAGWRRGQRAITAHSTRFIGMGQALAGGQQWDRWRQWVAAPRLLQLSPLGTKRTDIALHPKPAAGLIPTAATEPDEGGLSAPAPLPWRADPLDIPDDDGEEAWL